MAIEMPIPEPQMATPRSAWPVAIGPRQLGAELGIIDAVGAVGAKVDDLVAGLGQPGGDFCLHGEAGMVGGKGDFHGPSARAAAGDSPPRLRPPA